MNKPDSVEYPIDGILDLHTFKPSEVKCLVRNYIIECIKNKIFLIRIIHGKGKGILRNTVHSLLRDLPSVDSFHTASEEEGGWGATIVRLKR